MFNHLLYEITDITNNEKKTLTFGVKYRDISIRSIFSTTRYDTIAYIDIDKKPSCR